MKGRTIVLNKAAKDKLKAGIDQLADVVKVTLGPEGKTVIIANYNDNTTHITKDGVTVAEQVFLSDPIENVGAQIVKQVARKQSTVGDGTTTSIVLAQALIEYGLDSDIPNLIDFTKSLEDSKNFVIKSLQSQSKKIKPNSRLLESIATISANNDKSIGKIVAQAIRLTGKHGVVSAELGKTSETYIDHTKGMQLSSGFIAPQFISNLSDHTCELKDVCIFIYDKELRTAGEIEPILQFAYERKKSLLVIAEDITGVAKDTMLIAKISGQLQCCAIKSPDFGEYRTSTLYDLSALTGGVVIESAKVNNFSVLSEGHYGFADSVVIDKDFTNIIGGKGKESVIDERITQIEGLISSTGNAYEIKFMKDRIARLKGGAAVIYVGGYSELEIKEKKDRIEDAIYAAKAALEEGVVKGGGCAYVLASKGCENIVLRTALHTPMRQILFNIGLDHSEISRIHNNILCEYEPGYDAKKRVTTDMFKSGIVDPMKVVRTALENAVSIATTFLTTEAIIVEE